MVKIESLESRLFLSGTLASAVGEVKSAELVVSGDLKGFKVSEHTGAAVIKADLKDAGVAKSENKLYHMLISKGLAAGKMLAKDYARAKAMLNKDVAHLVSAEKHLLKKPTDATLAAAVTTAVTTLSTDASSSLAVQMSDVDAVQTTDDNSFNTLATTNPTSAKIQADTSDLITRLGKSRQTYQKDISALLSTAVTDVLNAVSG